MGESNSLNCGYEFRVSQSTRLNHCLGQRSHTKFCMALLPPAVVAIKKSPGECERIKRQKMLNQSWRPQTKSFQRNIFAALIVASRSNNCNSSDKIFSLVTCEKSVVEFWLLQNQPQEETLFRMGFTQLPQLPHFKG